MMKKYLFIILLFLAGFSAVEALPQINFSVYPAVSFENTQITIDARDSINSSGNHSGLYMRCQYFNGGTWTRWSANLVLKFRTGKVGHHQVKCEIRDRETGMTKMTIRNFQIKKDRPRRIRIKASKTNVKVGEPIDFGVVIPTISGENIDDIFVRWDFQSDGAWDTNFSRKKNVSYSYSKTGTTSPTVEVKFINGRIMKVRGIMPEREIGTQTYDYSQKINVGLPILFQPIVNVSPGAQGFTEKTLFTFDASKSKIPRLGWMEWSVDGQQWMDFENKKKITLNFNSAGTHQVRTRVCLGKSNTQCQETKTTVYLKNDPMDFSLSVNLQNRTNPAYSTVFQNGNYARFVPVEVGDFVRFSAIPSNYGYVEEILYRWDFNNDGVWDTDFSRNNYTETNFDNLGKFTVKVQAQSQDGVLAEAKREIRVNGNEKPTVYINHNPSRIFVGERVIFFPKFSSDINGQVRYDLDNDGIWESDFRGLSSQKWIYDTPGQKTIRAQIRDRGKNVRTITKTIFVNDIPEPKALVTVSKKYIPIGNSVIFDASASQGRNIKYYWDFNSKGQIQSGNSWETVPRGPARISRTFRTPGEKIISLTVVDQAGRGKQIFFSVIVVE